MEISRHGDWRRVRWLFYIWKHGLEENKMMSFKGIEHLHRKWNSLTDLVAYLQNRTNEQITYFDGMKVVTNAGEYMLADGKLSFTPATKTDDQSN